MVRNKKIKILFTIPNFDTAGSSKVVYDLVNRLDKTSFEPEICCFHNRGEYFKIIQSLGVKIHIFQFATPYKPFFSFPFRLYKIYRFFKKNRFDIIHSWHWSSDFSEPLAAKLAGISFVYTKKAMGWGNRAWLWRSKLSKHIIAVNKDMMRLFFAEMLQKVTKIDFGVNHQYFEIKSEITDSDINDSFIIVSVANLVPIKNIESLIEAVNLLNDKTIKVFIVGDCNTQYGKFLKKEYDNDHIRFLGKRSDVRPFLKMADLFIITTKKKGEGLPVALLEAMASGCIVLGTDVPGIRDVLEIFPDCLFPPGDIQILSKMIKEFKMMPENEKEILVLKLKKHIKKYYTINNFINQHEQLYKRLIKN